MNGTAGVMPTVLMEGQGAGTAAGFWFGASVDFFNVAGGSGREGD